VLGRIIKLSAIEYRFTNNAPGVLYIAKLSFSGEKKLQPAKPIFETANRITGMKLPLALEAGPEVDFV